MNRTFSLIQNARRGDKQSEEILVSENMPLVHSCARKFYRDGMDYDDLVQLGSIGLIKAIRRFDTGRGHMFSTYAVPLIIGEIKRHLRDDGIIKVSRSLKEIKSKSTLAHDELLVSLGREPTLSEIAAHIGVDTEKLLLAIDASVPPESLQKNVSPDGSGDITIGDTIKDSFSFGDELEKIALKSALDTLGAGERKIIILRYFMGKTQAEISQIIGVSQVQISRLEKKILASLKDSLS